MKILMLARPDLFSEAGGDTVQILNTKKALEKEGIQVDISLELSPDLRGYDIAHLFNLTRPQEPYLQACHARKFGIPLVMSTIYWNLMEVNKESAKYHLGKRLLGRLVLDENIKSRLLGIRDRILARDPGYALYIQRKMGYKNQQRLILDMCHLLLPNSKAEAEILQKDFGGYRKCHIVPNAVDPISFSKKDLSEKAPLDKPFVLSVGNLTIRKNHLALIKAVKELGLHLVLIGRYVPSQRRYADACLRECIRCGYDYLGELPSEKVIPWFYWAKVHALVSWVETPGLANLEAGLCECNIVSTEVGGTREYFRSYAWYCHPENPDSIRNAIFSAFHAPKTSELSKLIRNEYTWEKAAKETIQAYSLVLGAK